LGKEPANDIRSTTCTKRDDHPDRTIRPRGLLSQCCIAKKSNGYYCKQRVQEISAEMNFHMSPFVMFIFCQCYPNPLFIA
jgi:hypothetical protein